MQLTTYRSKLFAVDVFDDSRPSDKSPWFRIGEYGQLGDAVNACKTVIDQSLEKLSLSSLDPKLFTEEFLKLGIMPCIRGTDNLNTFDPYEYITARYAELVELKVNPSTKPSCDLSKTIKCCFNILNNFLR
jgi:hypothetical protein